MLLILWFCAGIACLTSTNALDTSSKMKETNQKGVTNQESKDCFLVVKNKEVKEIGQLVTMDNVNMIDLGLISGPNMDQLFQTLQITLVNGHGRGFISFLQIKYLIVTWTLNAGRQHFDLLVNESRKGCIRAHENLGDFVCGSLIKRFVGNMKTAYEVCYVDTKVPQRQLRCCKMTVKDLSKYQCYDDEDQYKYFNLFFAPSIPLMITALSFVFTICFCFYSLVRTPSQQTYDTYYRLTERTMSLACFCRWIFKCGGRGASIIRRILTVCLVSYLHVSNFRPHFQQTLLDVIFAYWALSFPFSSLLRNVNLSNDDHHQLIHGKPYPPLSKFIKRYFKYDVRDLQWGYNTEYKGLTALISLPCNIKRWKPAIEKNYRILHSNLKCRLRNSACNSLQKYVLYFLCGTLLCLVYIPVLFVMINILTSITLCTYVYSKFTIVVHSHSKKERVASRYRIFRSMHETLILILSLIFISVISVFAWIPFALGLLYNIIYFIPYITALSVCTFYFVQFWKTFDDKYFALKLFIYEEYRDRESGNNDNSNEITAPVDNNNRKGTIVPVVSKQLYHEIRERILPYHTSLCLHGLKILGLLIFSIYFLYFVTVLQASNATRISKVLTTASVSVFPYIFNAIVNKLSEKEQKAWDETMKLNVRRVVDELIAEDPELYQKPTLTIQPYCDGTTVKERSDSEPMDDPIGEAIEMRQYVTSM